MRELKDIIQLSGIKLDEEWANSPEPTNHPDQEEMGDLRDWGTNVELSLRRYLNHDLASPEFPKPITEDEMSAAYAAFLSETDSGSDSGAAKTKRKAIEDKIARLEKEKAAIDETVTKVNESAEEVMDEEKIVDEEDEEQIDEAQSEAQKAAFQKMLDAKNGNKEKATDEIEEEKVEEAKEEDEEEKVEETADPYSGLYRMLTLAGLNPQVAEAEESDEEVVEEATDEESEEEDKEDE